jgi:hypothetical protein
MQEVKVLLQKNKSTLVSSVVMCHIISYDETCTLSDDAYWFAGIWSGYKLERECKLAGRR